MQERQLLDLVGTIYDATLAPKGWTHFTRMLEEALGGAAVLLQISDPALEGATCVAPSLDPTFVEAYRERYQALDPTLPWIERLRPGSACFVRELVPDDELMETAFYREWMAPQELLVGPAFLGLIHRNEGEATSAAALRVFRPRGAPRYGPRQKRFLELLMPHLLRSVRIRSQTAQLSAERAAFATVVDQLRMGLMLVDPHGRLVAANRGARDLLSRRDGIWLEGDQLQVGRPAETAHLRGLLEQAGRCEEGTGLPAAGALCLPRSPGRRPLNALVSPLHGPLPLPEGDPPVAAIFVSDPEEGVEPPAAILRRFYGLTEAEAALARKLAKGYCLDEAASRVGITRETARSRLKDIFHKTGTGRQAALVSLLLRGPGQLEPAA